MSNSGTALMGVGEAEGDDRTKKAITAAIESPLVEVTLDGARGLLINISGGPDLTMSEVEEAQTITQRAAPDANIIFGATIDDNLSNKVKITVIATGFDGNRQRFLNNQKRPAPTPTTTQTTIPNFVPEPNVNKDLKQLVPDQDIPDGLDIVDEFDIPAFLRKNK